MLRNLLFGTLIIFGFISCADESTPNATTDSELSQLLEENGNGSLDFYKMPDSEDFANIPQDAKNPISTSKVELGQLLFHEPGLAVESKFDETKLTFSCASCHHAKAGFQANVVQGIGDGGMGFGLSGEERLFNPALDPTLIDVQSIRTPSALNIAFQTNVLWNGQFGATNLNENTSHLWTIGTPKEVNILGFEGTETQAIAGLTVHRFGLAMSQDLIQNTEYKNLFDSAFPNVPEADRYTNETAGLAIAAYERTLFASQSGFQKWLNGDKDAMTNEQKQGAILFFAHNCSDCHTGPALNSMEFHAFGLNDLENGSYAINVTQDDPEHLGRGGFTNIPEDNYKFKVPQLYNLKDSPFLGHGSSFNSVREMIEYKNLGIPQNPNVPEGQLANQFQPMGLSNLEIDLMVDFIENALYDPNLDRYVPEELPSGLCFPNNDLTSQYDLGCN